MVKITIKEKQSHIFFNEVSERNVIAFSAYHNNGYTDYAIGSRVLFPNVITNLGSSYDSSSSVFVSTHSMKNENL